MDSRIYEEVEEDLKFITTSGVRIKTMLSLMESPKTSSQLREEFGIGTSTIIHAARDLEKQGILIEKIDGYHLTNIGKIISMKLLDLIETLSVIKKTKQYWLTHDITGIPEEFLERLGELRGFKVIKSSPTNLLQVLSIYVKLVSKAKELKGVSPVFVPEFSKIVKKLLKRGAKVHLVISKEIMGEVLKSYEKEADEEVKEKIKEGYLKIWVIDDVKVAMTVTDSFISLGLFNLDGSYDFSTDMISYDREAIKWGRELFEYYKSRAKEIMLE